MGKASSCWWEPRATLLLPCCTSQVARHRNSKGQILLQLPSNEAQELQGNSNLSCWTTHTHLHTHTPPNICNFKGNLVLLSGFEEILWRKQDLILQHKHIQAPYSILIQTRTSMKNCEVTTLTAITPTLTPNRNPKPYLNSNTNPNLSLTPIYNRNPN